jgi:hypothetical protein
MRARRVSLALVALAGVVALWPAGSAGALAPDKSAYWVQPQSSSLPTTLPGPPDPVVPAGGLYVANTPDGPKAVSALTYAVDGTVSATLTLKVHSFTTGAPEAPSTPAGPPPSPNPALMHVAACVTHPWELPSNGSPGVWEHRPVYSVEDCVLGQFTPDGTTLSFFLTSDRQASTGVFDLAIVPVAVLVDPTVPQAVNRPFSVTFEAAGEDSLEPGEPEDPVFEEPEMPVFEEPPPTDFGGGGGGFETPVFEPPSTMVTPSAPPVPAAPVPRVRLTPRVAVPAAAQLPGDERGQRIMAVALLMALATAWWWFGGQQIRGPQLLGSLAAADRRPGRSVEPLGGIGRFARVRTKRPRPLI